MRQTLRSSAFSLVIGVCVGLIATACVRPALAQTSPDQKLLGTISGKVVDGNGSGIAGASVRLSGQDQSSGQEVLSGNDGQFSFANIPAGPFLLTITSAGFDAQSSSGVLHSGEGYVATPILLAAASPTGHVTGTVTDAYGDTLAGANVVLEGPAPTDTHTLISNDTGFFDFHDLNPGTYKVRITATGFESWSSPEFMVKPGQYVILTGSSLKIVTAVTSVSVSDSPEEIATEQVKVEEQQRVLGVFPNFYVVYDHDAAPLTTKLKFHLAFKASSDPVTVAGVGMLAGINQAADIPNYGQGLKGYSERFGASAADGFSDIMIGGAILPSLLHQDPRYFYQGTGTNKSRVFHAISSPFVCRGDNGRLQPNYSSVGGDLASAALSSAYYPPSNRGAGLVFENLTISTGERMLSTLIQEFVLHRYTPKARN